MVAVIVYLKGSTKKKKNVQLYNIAAKRVEKQRYAFHHSSIKLVLQQN